MASKVEKYIIVVSFSSGQEPFPEVVSINCNCPEVISPAVAVYIVLSESLLGE